MFGGYPPTAIGYPPTAIGYPPTAIGYPPTAINYPPTAIGYPPTAIGYPPTAIGYPPTAIGYPPTAIGYSPTAIGYTPTAIGYTPTTIGYPPTAISYPPAAIIGRIGHSEFFFIFYYGNPWSAYLVACDLDFPVLPRALVQNAVGHGIRSGGPSDLWFRFSNRPSVSASQTRLSQSVFAAILNWIFCIWSS